MSTTFRCGKNITRGSDRDGVASGLQPVLREGINAGGILTTVIVMLEPSRFALTSTPSIAPSAAEVTRPVSAGPSDLERNALQCGQGCQADENRPQRPFLSEVLRVIVITPPVLRVKVKSWRTGYQTPAKWVTFRHRVWLRPVHVQFFQPRRFL